MSSEHHPVDVSLAEVAHEDPTTSVEREADATGDPVPGAESSNDTAPEEPSISTVTGIGPVSDGDDLAI